MIYLTKKVSFSASHILRNPKFSNEKNQDVYGKCAWENGHGHNYTLEVTVKGEIPEDTGMIIDLKELKKILEDTVIEKLDHKFINYDTDFMKGIIPTSENLALGIWGELQKVLQPGLLHEIKLWETDNNWVVYRGE